MPRFETIPAAQVKKPRAVSEAKKRALRKYTNFISKLSADTAGKITLAKGEKYSTVRRYLKEASGSLGTPTRVRRDKNVLYVYLTKKKGPRRT